MPGELCLVIYKVRICALCRLKVKTKNCILYLCHFLFAGKDKLNNNISVTIEYVTLSDKEVDEYDANVDESEVQISDEKTKPVMDKSSAKELVKHVWGEWKNIEEWSGNIEEEASEEAKNVNNKPEYNHLLTLDNTYSFDGTEEHEKTVSKKPNPEV